MSLRAKFAYSQARLQARHGERLDAAGWRRLHAVGDFLQLLQVARSSTLRPWVLPFNEDTDVHAMELWLRRQFRQYVRTVASWQPAPWRDALRWTLRLIDLPALRYLLSGESPWPWMREDEELAPFLAEDMHARVETMRASDCAPMVHAWDADAPLLDGWLAHWRELWPGRSKRLTAPLVHLGALLDRHIDLAGTTHDTRETERERERLEHRFEVGFRRHTQQPAAAYFHLGLIAADLVALRGELVRHRLFDATRPVAG